MSSIIDDSHGAICEKDMMRIFGKSSGSDSTGNLNLLVSVGLSEWRAPKNVIPSCFYAKGGLAVLSSNKCIHIKQ